MQSSELAKITRNHTKYWSDFQEDYFKNERAHLRMRMSWNWIAAWTNLRTKFVLVSLHYKNVIFREYFHILNKRFMNLLNEHDETCLMGKTIFLPHRSY